MPSTIWPLGLPTAFGDEQAKPAELSPFRMPATSVFALPTHHSVGEACFARLIQCLRLAVGDGGGCLPDRLVYRIADEAHRGIGQSRVDPAGMFAAGRVGAGVRTGGILVVLGQFVVGTEQGVVGPRVVQSHVPTVTPCAVLVCRKGDPIVPALVVW